MNIVFEGSSDLRSGYSQLFQAHRDRARAKRLRFKLVAGGPRTETIKDFLRFCSTEPSSLNVLLIDSEGPVTDTVRYISDSIRSLSVWNAGGFCSDEQLHLMVQAMEAWFVADPQSLRRHFGRDYNTRALPSPQAAETVSAADLVTAIRRGLPHSRRRRGYDKVSDGVELLRWIDVDIVSQHCVHFRRLWAFLDRSI